jgi:hypothetical protein
MRVGDEISFDLLDVSDEKGKTSVKIGFGVDGVGIHPEGMGVKDGDYAPILIERDQGKIRLIYWPDINQEEPVIVDLSGALESARLKLLDMYYDGICPDCDTPIPTDAVEGDSCSNCGHVWTYQRPCDD